MNNHVSRRVIIPASLLIFATTALPAMAQVPFINGWVYDNDRGWLFTDADHYPMIYTHNDDTWHYFELGSSDPRYFFNFKSQQWEAWDALPDENDSNLADNNNL